MLGIRSRIVKTEPSGMVLGETVTVEEVVQAVPATEEVTKEDKRGLTAAEIASTRQQAGRR